MGTSRARCHSQENPVSHRLRSRLFTHRVAIIITLLGGILLVGFGLALRSQYSEATLSSLPPEHLTWPLQVKGFVHNELNLTIEDLLQMPQTRVDADIYCLPSPEARQGYFHEGGIWTGVKLRDILEQASILPTTQKLAFYAQDGFTTDLAIDVAFGDNVIIAYAKDGKPLRQYLRVVVPGRWGYKWIHSLLLIEAVDYDFKGRYEQNGFPDEAINSALPYP